jgi:valyl-tRNA synthetase
VVEPLISEQWFVKMKPLAGPALRVVRQGKVKFVPERFTKVYENWMENVRDWCISRQLWWGHRIPAWYCQDCGEVIVARGTPDKCPRCKAPVKQDEDVLDTWFSSGLWPFSTLGWPDRTPDLEYFFPTDVLVTGYDIIFFWVARMIFLSMEFMGEEPFHHVVIHGMVRDGLGRKMSKSLGNGIDPLDVVSKYGADALRISLVTGTAMGSDMRLYDEKVEGARNFCNKLWNATRYCLMNLEGWTPPSGRPAPQSASGRWILSRLERAIEAVRDALNRFEPGDAVAFLSDFIWNEFCDWYIEISKRDLADGALAGEARAVLWTVLRDSLALLHPFAPFVTEELWDHLPGRAPGPEGSLIAARYPAAGSYAVDEAAEEEVNALIEAIKAIRNMRAEVNIPTGKKARTVIAADAPGQWEERRAYVERLAWAEPLEIAERADAGQSGAVQPAYAKQALTSVVKGAEIYLPLQGLIDVDREIARLERAIDEIAEDIERTSARLEDPAFLSRAPEDIVLAQRKRSDEEKEKAGALRARVEMLKKAAR